MSEETITLGGGCFWCIEAVLSDLKGVNEAVSGYTGGEKAKPSYEEVCSGRSGHVEVVQVHFQPDVISLHDLLTIFFTLHDPTTVNRQGNDVGEQYRSVIFYASEEQKMTAQTVMEEIDARGIWPDPIVTTLEPASAFYEAEEYHQRYFERNENQAYCQFIIAPKVAKLRKEFRDKLNASS
jgi:peptide-methionine (S)-S-oxide reductase